MAKNISKYVRYLSILITISKYAILIYCTLDIFLKQKNNIYMLLLSLILMVSLFVYEILKEKFKFPFLHFIIAEASLLLLLERTGSLFLIYYFFLLDDIYESNIDIRYRYIGWHGLGYVLVRIWEERSLHIEDFVHIFISLIFYLIVVIIFYIIHHFKYERDKFKMLYDNLVTYSFQEREYAILQERTKISQELHDSLGHLFMGGLLILRYAKEIDKKNNGLLTKELSELEEVLEQGIRNLRMCVKNVRKMEENKNLTEEILHISERFEKLGITHISFIAFPDIEDLNSRIKNCCYKVIRESITNSIIHGNATDIKIMMQTEDNHVLLLIKDNGIGVDKIDCSYGLDGMKKRVTQIGGNIEFSSSINKGFSVEVSIPNEGGDTDD